MQAIIGPEYSKIVIPLLDQAKTNLDIFQYSWGLYAHASQTPMQRINYAIKSAATRGVTCRALLHPGSPSDHLQSLNAATAAALQVWGVLTKFTTASGVLHAKGLIIDKRLAILGSHNFSMRSMVSNIEISILVDDAAVVQRLLQFYEILWRQS
jgi:phosphatidylserine/phosphatidylglycerophosphate/cardiolipin synthase-like enzyme